MNGGRFDICVVSYRRPAVLAECLAGLREHLSEAQVRVWDNRSSETDAVRALATRYPEVDWTFADDARGYAAAVNALVERCPADRDILLLNPDAILTGSLPRTRAQLLDPTVAAASPTVLDPTHKQERWDAARRKLTVPRAIVNRSGYAARLRGNTLSSLYPAPPGDVDGYIAGVCLFVSRAAWNDVGPFDERYFLYGEDVDWQRRARRRGWRLVMVDEPEVHHGAESVASGTSAAGQRAKDTLAANTAVLVGGRRNYGRWTLVTASDLLLDRVQRSRRRVRRSAAKELDQFDRHPVVITTNSLSWGDEQLRRVATANEWVERGHPVTLVCLQALGPLQRKLDDRVRLVLRPWWQPVLDVPGDDAVVLSGTTRTEIAFAAAWRRLGHRRLRRRWTIIENERRNGGERWWTRAALSGSDRTPAAPRSAPVPPTSPVGDDLR